jgi:hypothetical protein
VKDRKGFDMTYFGSTRAVDQASATPSLDEAWGSDQALNPTDSTHGNRNPVDLNYPFLLKKAENSGLPRF